MSGSQGKAERFARNLVWNLLGHVGAAGIAFFSVPYLLRRMGPESYGLYILLQTVLSCLLLFTFGSAPSNLKHLAQFWAARDRRGVRDSLRYAAYFHLAGVALGALVLAAAARFVAGRVLHLPGPLLETGVFVLRCAAAGALSLSLIQLVGSSLQGIQRFDRLNLILLAQSALLPLGAAGLLAAGLGLRAVALWHVLLNTALSLLALAAGRALLRPSAAFPEGKGLGPGAFASYSFVAWLVPLAGIVSFQFDKVLVARRVSLADLTLYSIPIGLLQRLQVVPAAMATTLLPMVGELQGPQEGESLRRMYLVGARALLWTVLPVQVLLFALMPQFLTLWVGGDFGGSSVWTARLMVFAQVLLSMTQIPNSVAVGRGRPGIQSAAAWLQALASAFAWWALIPRHGILGAAMGSLAAQALSTALSLGLVHRSILDLGAGRFLREVLLRPSACALALLALVFPLHALAYTWPRLILLGCAGAGAYAACAWRFADPEDRRLLERLLRGPGP